MDLAIMNNSLEFAMQGIEQEVNANDNFQSPSWSSSEIISNNEELLSFIGDNNFTQFMDTLDKLNSPTKLEKEADIRDSLVEFLQEQFKSTDAHAIKNEWAEFDNGSTLIPSSMLDVKYSSYCDKVESTANENSKNINVFPYLINNESNVSISSFGYDNLNVFANSTKLNNACFINATNSFSDCLKDNDITHQVSITMPCNTDTNTLLHIDGNSKFINCKDCDYKCMKQCMFKVHILNHLGSKNFLCSICGTKVSRNFYLDHTIQHKPLNFDCPVCCFTTLDHNILTLHILEHKNKYHCLVCNNTDTSKRLMLNYSCTFCNYKTKHESYLQKHLLHHTNKKVFECHLCDYKATHRKMIIEHCSKHTGKYLKCKLCDFKTVYRNNFKTHEAIHSGKKAFVCDVCGFKFAQRSNLKAHMATHLGQKNFECYLCDYKATQKANLKAHIITHIGEKNLACNICNYKASNRNTLKTHMTMHSAEKIFECNTCNYKTAHKSGLRRHLRVHTGEKRFLCDVCDYKTSRKDYINRHMLKHTGEKFFFCNFCDYKTAYRNGLNVHNALVHMAAS